MNYVRKIDFGFHVVLVITLLFSMLLNEGALGFVLIAQFFVGIYQLLSSIGRTVKYHSFDPVIQKMLITYWIGVLVYAAGWAVLIPLKAYDYIQPYLLSSWIIAIYYCCITYLLAYPKYIKSHLDI